MARERFESRKLTGKIRVACKFDDGTKYWEADKATVVSHIIDIVTTYSQKGYKLTLRQLHYQFVTRNWIINHTTAYKKLGTILDDCRYSGIIDWNAIEDRGRVPYIPFWANNVAEALEGLQRYYRVDRQKGQPYHIELWTEKDALSGILKGSTSKYHIQLVVNKGYTSSSAVYGAYSRIVEALERGQKVTILYFGDHDPSGLDMVRDIRERLTHFICRGSKFDRTFSDKVNDWWEAKDYGLIDLIQGEYVSQEVIDRIISESWGGVKSEDREDYSAGLNAFYLAEHDLFEVLPIGLTMEQIQQYDLPPNPAKLTDTRADKYIEAFGSLSWEVDALNPETLTEIVETNIVRKLDAGVFNDMLEQESKDVNRFTEIIETEKKRK